MPGHYNDPAPRQPYLTPSPRQTPRPFYLHALPCWLHSLSMQGMVTDESQRPHPTTVSGPRPLIDVGEAILSAPMLTTHFLWHARPPDPLRPSRSGRNPSTSPDTTLPVRAVRLRRTSPQPTASAACHRLGSVTVHLRRTLHARPANWALSKTSGRSARDGREPTDGYTRIS